jgi:uncharacterized protein YigE (DUF2233 family)
MIRALALILALILPAAALAQDCQSVTYKDNAYSICSFDMTTTDLRLFLYDGSGAVLGQFSSVDSLLAEDGSRLAFAMNAGMYHSDRSPVGLYVERGAEVMRLVPGAGPGNFGLVPNGVFCIREGRADVFETSVFQQTSPSCDYATQSGPMLVIDGTLHPRFLVDGTSKYIRNGVGTTADGKQAVFAISDNPVNFHDFGTFFRDELGLPNALYFDGKVSRLYAPSLGRSDLGFSLGPMVGVVVPNP